uniref:RING-type domain-containing protein n=1 Tax=Maylandia zebra TaxID=106582 RepID=A0A3P9B6M0_9CICH
MFLFFLPQSADMSAASNLRSEDQFLCSICLDVFTDPVSAPCGHNFCKTCISQHWDMNQSCQCPMCKETFYTRPQLRKLDSNQHKRGSDTWIFFIVYLKGLTPKCENKTINRQDRADNVTDVCL